MKKILLLLLAIVVFSCSDDDEEVSDFIPVDSTHLLNGKWDVTKIENYQGELLFSECDLSDLFIEFLDHEDTAVWRRVRINSSGCTSSSYGYDSWGVYENSLGYVRLYNQGVAGSTYRKCKADIKDGNILRLCMVQSVNGQSNEVLTTYPEEEREYYYFIKSN